MNTTDKIPDELLAPGTALRVFYSKGNINNRIEHIRAIVDDVWIVYRVWSRRKGWVYHVDHRYHFDYGWKCGHIKEAKS